MENKENINNDINNSIDKGKIKDIDEAMFNEAYVDLNNENVGVIDDFEEPYDVKLSDKLDENLENIVNDTEEEDSNNRKQLTFMVIGIAMFIICCFGLVHAINAKKTVEFSSNGMKNISDWNKFKENCNKSKKDCIVIKIMSKDELESKEELKFDGKYYTYGKNNKKYKYLIDKKGMIQDLGSDIRFIVLANKKYKFEQLYQGMAEMDKEEYEYVDTDELNKSVETITNTLEEIDKDMTYSNNSDNQDDAQESSQDDNKAENEEKIQYELIFCY